MALSNVLAVFGYIVKYFPILLKFMQAAEETKETGVVKKAMVTGALKSVVHVAAAESTGGAKESWDQLKDPFDIIIDATASAVFGSKESIKFEDHGDR